MIDGLWHGIITYGLFAVAVGRKSRGGSDVVGLLRLPLVSSLPAVFWGRSGWFSMGASASVEMMGTYLPGGGGVPGR